MALSDVNFKVALAKWLQRHSLELSFSRLECGVHDKLHISNVQIGGIFYFPWHRQLATDDKHAKDGCCGKTGNVIFLGADINDGLSRIQWTFSDSMDFTVCSIRCVYRAELILGR